MAKQEQWYASGCSKSGNYGRRNGLCVATRIALSSAVGEVVVVGDINPPCLL